MYLLVEVLIPTCGTPTDSDQDGVIAQSSGGADCEDNDPKVYPGANQWVSPGAQEPCDGADTYCDGSVDLDASGLCAVMVDLTASVDVLMIVDQTTNEVIFPTPLPSSGQLTVWTAPL